MRQVPESGGIESPADEPTLGEIPWSRRRARNTSEKPEKSENIKDTENHSKDENSKKPVKESIEYFLKFINSFFRQVNNHPSAIMGRINMLNKAVQTGNLMPVTQQKELDMAAGKFE